MAYCFSVSGGLVSWISKATFPVRLSACKASKREAGPSWVMIMMADMILVKMSALGIGGGEKEYGIAYLFPGSM